MQEPLNYEIDCLRLVHKIFLIHARLHIFYWLSKKTKSSYISLFQGNLKSFDFHWI
jgi:hypothetical protein